MIKKVALSMVVCIVVIALLIGWLWASNTVSTVEAELHEHLAECSKLSDDGAREACVAHYVDRVATGDESLSAFCTWWPLALLGLAVLWFMKRRFA